MNNFSGRAGIQQRVIPFYRVDFFETLAKRCERGLGVFAGDPKLEEEIRSVEHLQGIQFTRCRNFHFSQTDSPFYLCWQSGNISWLKEWQPDVLVVEANPRYVNIRSMVTWMHKNNRPVIGWGLGAPEIRGPFSGFRKSARKKLLLSLDALIAYSSKGAEEYRKFGIPESKVFIANNAVATRKKDSLPARGDEYDGKPKVLFVGRLQKRKRVDNLIKACSQLPDEIKPDLRIVGDGPVKAELIDLAKKIYPETYFPGALFGDELEQQFLDADIFVLPGTGGLAVQQAMAYGLPVIVEEGDGTQTDLIRDVNGWILPQNDIQGLKQILERALSDVELLRLMGGESFKIVSEEINIENMADVFVDVFSEVLNAPRQPGG